MTNPNHSPAKTSLHEQIDKLNARLAALLPRLVEAEAEMSERLAAIGRFEFTLRSRISHLTRRLDELDAEIQELRRQARWLDDDWYDGPEPDAAAWAAGESAAEGDYRYREARGDEGPRPSLSEAEKTDLKQLYRQLARRFHPDLAQNETDRAYRTDLMMAINAAYAAGDVARLHELALEPDTIVPETAVQQGEQLVEALEREFARVQRRLEEIEADMARLANHRSARMMRQAEKAAAEDRDWFAEVEKQLQDRIAEKRARRDILQQQLASMDEDERETAVSDRDFADLVWDATLDETFDDDISSEFDRYIQRRRDHIYFEDDFDDDYDYE